MKNKSKKIFFIAPSLGGGGAERVAVALSDYFVRHDYEFTFLITMAKGSRYDIPSGVTLIDEFAREDIRPINQMRLIRKYMKRNKEAIFISFLPYQTIGTLQENLGIADRCNFLGWVGAEQKEQLFKTVSIYCLPSKNEGMPMSVLEAMSWGVPTIATPVGGIPQIIENGVNGFMFPVDDINGLSRCMRDLLQDKELRAQIGAAGRATISEAFNIERNTVQLVELYKEIVG